MLKKLNRRIKRYKKLGFHTISLKSGLKEPSYNGFLNEITIPSGYQNIGIVTGKKSGITVIDFDFYSYDKKKEKVIHNKKTEEYWEDLCERYNIKQYVHQKTASEGYHLFFKYNPRLRSCFIKGYNMEIKNDKVYIVLDPSKLDENKKKERGSYKFIVKPWEKNIKDMPIELEKELMELNNSTSIVESKSYDDVIDILNEEFGEEYKWEIKRENDGLFKVINNCKDCLLKSGLKHSTPNHSCLWINSKTVKVQCFSPDCKDKRIKINENWKKIKRLLGLVKDTSGEDKEEKLNNEEKLWYRLIDIADEKGFKRESGYVMRPNTNIPILYENYKEYKDFIDECFLDEDDEYYKIYRKSSSFMNNLLRRMEGINERRFSFLKHNKYVVAFNNGYLDFSDLYDLKFIKYEDMEDQEILTSIHFDKDFDDEILNINDFTNLQTPILDQICLYQLPSEEVYAYFLGMAGRLHYPTKKYDEFQCCMFIKGGKNVGKSTTANILMSSHQNIGTISSTMEETFGYKSLSEKNVICISDMSQNFHKKIKKAQLQSMITGERLEIPRKNFDPITIIWEVPLLFVSNYDLGYNDPTSAFVRRICFFLMEKHVQNRDSSLEKKCIKEEGDIILIKTLLAYREMLSLHKDKTFEDFGVRYFEETRELLTSKTNHFYKFLNSPKEDNEENVFFKEGTSIKESKLMKIYSTWLKEQGRGLKPVIEKTTLNQFGFEYIKKTMCKVCGKEPTGKRKPELKCCPDFNNKNRVFVRYIKNMEVC